MINLYFSWNIEDEADKGICRLQTIQETAL